MEIRRAKIQDKPAIMELLNQVLMVHHNGRPDLFKSNTRKYTDDELDIIINDDKTPVFVAADENDTVMGYAFCISRQALNDNILTDIKTLYIDDLCVEEKMRGLHIGKSLYEYVVNYARDNGYYNITLNVWSCNKNALKFYEKMGLVPQKTGMEMVLKQEIPTLKNPFFWADIPDVDVLRHGDTYYMVSTTMHMMPGCPVMRSKDLMHWEIVSYVYDIIGDNDAYFLRNGKNSYGQGQWATSLRYHNGLFYVCFACNDMRKTYIYHTDDIETGKWKRYEYEGIYHDPSLLFDDDGKVYIFYNCGDIMITELKEDLSGIAEGGINRLLFSTPKENMGLRCEGCHAYKINGYYMLIFIEWPRDGHQRRREVCYRSKELLGPYERKIIMDDDLSYHNKGVAQGAIFDSPDGRWFAMFFQDHDAVGRVPCIMPMQWEDGWPAPGIDGKTPHEFAIPFKDAYREEAEKDDGRYDIAVSDDFNYESNVPDKRWQWNHNPDNDNWSFTERPGFFRIKTARLAAGLLDAINTLTQRTEGPACQCTALLHVNLMKPGDYAGLAAFQSNYGTVGVRIADNGKFIIMQTKDNEGCPVTNEEIPFDGDRIYLRIHFDFKDSRDIADFYYSEDGMEFRKIGWPLKMLYTLDHFMGYRMGLYNYATVETGGIADFEFFDYKRF